MTDSTLSQPLNDMPGLSVTDRSPDARALLREERALARPERRVAMTTVLVGLAALVVAISAIGTWPVGVFQDDGIYAILARGLASGDGSRYLNIPGGPHATHYPPAYPAFLALLWTFSPTFPSNVALFTFASAIFLALAAAGAHRFGVSRLGLSNGRAAAAALATVACVPTLIFGVFVMSEPMFMALVFPAAFLAERAAESARPRDALVAGAVAGALAMVRTTGQFFVPALVLVLLVRRQWRPALMALAGAALFLVPWQLWVNAYAGEIPPVLVGKYGPYSQWLGDAVRAGGAPFVLQVIAKNLRELGGMAWTMFAGRDPAGSAPSLFIRLAIDASLVTLLAIGTARAVRRIPVTLLFLVAYVGLVLVWPFEPTRFMWALLPLFGLLVALGVDGIARWRPPRPAWRLLRASSLALCALLGAGYAVYNVRGVRERWWETMPKQYTSRATPLVDWVRASTRPGDLLATDDDALLHLYTGRHTVPVGTFTPQEYLDAQTYAFATQQLERIIAIYKPRYVLCSTSYGVMAARELLKGDKPTLRIVTTLSRGVVFERIGE